MGAESRQAQFVVESTLSDLRKFPDDVKKKIGFDLRVVQDGDMPEHATPMRGFDPAVLELRVTSEDATYRCCVTVKLKYRIYILHVFKKKSTKDGETPEKELKTIRQRLLRAGELDAEYGRAAREQGRRGA